MGQNAGVLLQEEAAYGKLHYNKGTPLYYSNNTTTKQSWRPPTYKDHLSIETIVGWFMGVRALSLDWLV
jgi:hypothetical protein